MSMPALHAAESAVAPVDRDDDARDEGGDVAEQVEHRPDEILRRTELVGRGVREDLLPARFERAGRLVGQQEAVLVGQEEAGGDGVAADAQLCHVHGVPLGEIVDGALGSRIGRDLREGPDGVHRGDVQHIPFPGFDHVLREDHRGEQGALEVEVEDLVEACGVESVERVRRIVLPAHLLHLAGGFRGIASGAVDEHVDLPEFCMDAVTGRLQGLSVQCAGGNAEAFDAEFPGDGFAPGGVVRAAADDGEVDPGVGESPGERRPDHAEATGDHAVATFQVIECISFHDS